MTPEERKESGQQIEITLKSKGWAWIEKLVLEPIEKEAWKAFKSGDELTELVRARGQVVDEIREKLKEAVEGIKEAQADIDVDTREAEIAAQEEAEERARKAEIERLIR